MKKNKKKSLAEKLKMDNFFLSILKFSQRFFFKKKVKKVF